MQAADRISVFIGSVLERGKRSLFPTKPTLTRTCESNTNSKQIIRAPYKECHGTACDGGERDKTWTARLFSCFCFRPHRRSNNEHFFYTISEENEEGDNDSVFLEEGEDIDCVSNSKAEPPDRNSLSDCMIAFSDLQFSERIKTGGCLEMHRGQWHGDVIIHKYDPSVEDVFWTKISMLRMIRHENIALFMGACAEPPNFAIVTSVRKGQSLYEKIHNSKDAPLPLHSKFSIAKQIAQGMGYLHARGIVLERLNSENIFLESKVKIFVLDHSFSENRLERSDCACLPRGRATYFAPEILRTMRIENQQVKLEQNTKESDTFAFGTVLYELFNGRFPHDKQPIHTIIWNVGSGNTLKLNHLKCPEVIKTLIRDSWAFLPSSRPGFVDINKILQTVVHLKKRHSSSEPDSIHKIGVMLGS